MTELETFWKGKPVLVTGHTGFQGSWLSLWLQRLGARVIGFSLPPPTRPSLFEAAGVARGMVSLKGDIRDAGAVKSAVFTHRPRIVFHLAAQPLVRASYAAPLETYSTNVMGTANLLEAARLCGAVRAVVNVTSDKCYENIGQSRGYREDDRLGGHDPYSASKACSEILTDSYRRSFFTGGGPRKPPPAVSTARSGNVIGGGDWARDRLVPDCVRALARGLLIRLRYPEAVRPWQHVLEPLHGCLLLAQGCVEKGDRFAEAWNFGPEEGAGWPVRSVVEEIIRLTGRGKWKPRGGPQPHEAETLKLDAAKARRRLGWSPLWDTATALQKTVAWYQAYERAPRRAREATLAQIDEHERAGRARRQAVSGR